MKRQLPTCEYLYQCFELDTKNWRLIRKERPDKHFKTNRAKYGWNDYVGTVCAAHINGELSVKLDGKQYLQKHIIFRMVTGRVSQVLSYKDGNKNNLNPDNLVEGNKKGHKYRGHGGQPRRKVINCVLKLYDR